MEKERVGQDKETMKRLAETTFYTIMPQLMKNVTLNIELGLSKELGMNDLFIDYFKGEGRGKSHDDKRILVIAAGPSIDMYGHLDMLKEYYKDRNFTVVAVDAVFDKLCKKGLYPDYVISADVQEETANFYRPLTVKKHHANLIKNKTAFILMGNLDPSIIKLTEGMRRFFYWPTAAFGKNMDAGTMWDLMVPFGIVNPHGHVTGAALSIFANAKPRVLALIGGDYSYEPGIHYEDTFWYKWLAMKGRTHDEIIDNLRPEKFEDRITGEEIMSDVTYINYVAYMFNWLESVKNMGGQINLANCTGRGLFYDKEGLVPYVSFEKFLEGTTHGQGN